MAHQRIDLAGGAGRATSSDPKRSAKSGGGGGDGNQKLKVILAAVLGVAAIGVIGFQVFPGLFSGRARSTEAPAALTEPVQANSTDLAPGTTEPPIQPKPRGSAKRATGG